MPDTANRFFLTKHDSLKSVTVGYKENQPHMIVLILKDTMPRKYFDLRLEGDRYFFSRKYGAIQYLNVEHNNQIPWPKNSGDVILTATTFDGDSVVCFGMSGPPDLLRADRSLGTPMHYRGDLNALARRIEQNIWRIGVGSVVDSALVFEGTVTEEYELKDLRLVLGEKSVFSDLAAHVLLEQGDFEFVSLPKAGWYPATNRIRVLKARSRIFVKLEQDGSVTIETPRNLWSTGGN